MTHKHKPFTTLTRRQRRARTLRIKHIIHRERARCGGLHFDDCEPANTSYWSWSDILFLGNTPDVYWNAVIVTTADELQGIIEQIVLDEAFALLDENEKAQELHFETTPNYDAKGNVISHSMVNFPKATYIQFGGLTFSDYVDKRINEIVCDNPPAVKAGYKFLPGYAAGLGLQIIVAESVLTRDIIDNAIRAFLKGEMASIQQ